ncbi:MAG: hypothetical protein QF768_01665 [Candidatus Latescibacteria bacterium]|nr:hypothetical protein [Candidatus Latescibacterota bacterium]
MTQMPNHLHPNHLHDDELIALASGEGEAPKHLKDCPRCASRFKEFERTLALTTTSMPQMEWNPLQSGGFMHRVRRGIELQSAPRPVPWWQPGLGGAGLMLVVLLAIQAAVDQPALEQDSLLARESPDTIDFDEEGLSRILVDGSTGFDYGETVLNDEDDELLILIDAYLIDTATEDELMMSLGDLTEDGVGAAFDL